MLTTTKFAISVPIDVMCAVDRAAKQRGWSRSRYISNLLGIAARKRTDAEISRAIDAVMVDLDVAGEQRRTARAFQRAGSRVGTRW